MQAHRLPARHGFLWLIASFKLFRSNPPLITALTMAYLFVIFAVNIIPKVGPFLLPLALPTLIVVLANGCRAVQRGGGVGGIALTFGLQKRRVELVRLGGLHLLGSIAILVVYSIISGGQLSLFEPGKTVSEEEVIDRRQRDLGGPGPRAVDRRPHAADLRHGAGHDGQRLHQLPGCLPRRTGR